MNIVDSSLSGIVLLSLSALILMIVTKQVNYFSARFVFAILCAIMIIAVLVLYGLLKYD